MAQKIYDIHRGSITTTDATQTTAFTYILPPNSGATFNCNITLRDTANKKTAGLVIMACINDNAGTSALEGSVQTLVPIFGNVALVTALGTFDVSSNIVRLRITGILATTLDWQWECKIINN